MYHYGPVHPYLTAGLRQPSWCLHTWGEGKASWNNPRTVTVTSDRLGRGVLKLSWYRAWWLSPSQGCHGTRCCYQNLPGVMDLAGVTCKSKARRKQYVKKKRLLEVCGDSAWDTQLQSLSWGFSRLVSSLESARVFLSAEELPGHLLLLLCCFSRYLASSANWCCWTVRGGPMTQGRCQLPVPWEWVNEQVSSPWDLVEVLAGVWREKQAGWSHTEPCLHLLGWGWRACLGSLALLWGQGTRSPQEQPAVAAALPGFAEASSLNKGCWNVDGLKF